MEGAYTLQHMAPPSQAIELLLKQENEKNQAPVLTVQKQPEILHSRCHHKLAGHYLEDLPRLRSQPLNALSEAREPSGSLARLVSIAKRLLRSDPHRGRRLDEPPSSCLHSGGAKSKEHPPRLCFIKMKTNGCILALLVTRCCRPGCSMADCRRAAEPGIKQTCPHSLLHPGFLLSIWRTEKVKGILFNRSAVQL